VNISTTLVARLLLQHLLDRKLRDVEKPCQIGGRQNIEVRGRVIDERFYEEDSRVVDKDID